MVPFKLWSIQDNKPMVPFPYASIAGVVIARAFVVSNSNFHMPPCIRVLATANAYLWSPIAKHEWTQIVFSSFVVFSTIVLHLAYWHRMHVLI